MTAPKKHENADTSGGDAGQAEVQAKFDEAADKGYFGSTPDDTPNENYTLRTKAEAPTPENTRVHPSKEKK